jgi:hypothetical protein
MKASLKFSLIVACLLFAMNSCGIVMKTPRLRISGYCGDGTIAPLKDAVNPGFKVEFEPFSLAGSHTADYSLDCVPKPRWHDLYHAGLVLELTQEEGAPSLSPPTWLGKGSLGTLTLRLFSRTGRTLFDDHADVANLSWSRYSDNLPYGQPGAVPGDRMAWTFPSGQEDPDYQQPWMLHVDYEPGTDSLDRQARIRFMAGGME